MVIIFLITGSTPACKKTTNSSSPYPTLLHVKITPENPKTTHDLHVTMEGMEGNNLTLKYYWKRNGKVIFGETSETLDHLNFSKHDTISVAVTPFKGDATGKPVVSDPIVIMNTKPSIYSATIQPQPAYTNSQLEIMVEPSDEDDDYISYAYQWIKNDQEIAYETSNVLSSLCFERGDSIQCIIIPSDRESEGKPFTTDPIIIANSPPLITSQPTSEIIFEGFFRYKVGANDPDQDTLVFSLSPSSPEGITVDPSNGVIKWKIPKDLTGRYPIEIIVSDGCGGRCSQSFNLFIAES